jgi:hypothetical protein
LKPENQPLDNLFKMFHDLERERNDFLEKNPLTHHCERDWVIQIQLSDIDSRANQVLARIQGELITEMRQDLPRAFF